MNTQALWQTFKPLVPYSWLLVLWAWLVNVLYFANPNTPEVVAVLLTVLLSTMFAALAALAQVALTETVKKLWETYQYHVQVLEYKAKQAQEEDWKD